ncbi:MAG: mono/diheme cytochrome c family protein [Paraglaciecola sp.]|jgi:mono/diheme cytochrome c family protein
MKITILSTIFALAIFACGSSETNNNESGKKPATAKKIAKKVDGKKVYKTYCVTCHGLYGDMGASGAKNLIESVLSLDERIEIITNGKGLMTPFKDLLNAEKIKAVAEYTMTLKDK